MRIRAFRLHLGMYLGGYISQDVLNAVLSYIIAFIFLGSVATASTITTWMAVAQLVSVGARHLARAAHPRRAFLSHRALDSSPPASSASPCSTTRVSPTSAWYLAVVVRRRPRSRRAQLHPVERLQLHARRR